MRPSRGRASPRRGRWPGRGNGCTAGDVDGVPASDAERCSYLRSSRFVHRSCVVPVPGRGVVGGTGHDGPVTVPETVIELPEEALRSRASEVLRTLAGPAARLRDDQWTAVRALVVQRRRALVVQRTGWGKSAVYFVATALLRAGGAGPTVIVSPPLALMRNQIDAAGRAGVHAVTVNSSNVDEWQNVYADVQAGHVDVLLVSP